MDCKTSVKVNSPESRVLPDPHRLLPVISNVSKLRHLHCGEGSYQGTS